MKLSTTLLIGSITTLAVAAVPPSIFDRMAKRDDFCKKVRCEGGQTINCVEFACGDCGPNGYCTVPPKCDTVSCDPTDKNTATCAAKGCGECNSETKKCDAKQSKNKRQSFVCNDIYCDPLNGGDASCQTQGCGSCNTETSKCSPEPAKEKRQGAPITAKCGEISCKPGVVGDKSCVNNGCGYCDKQTSKCARYPELSDKRDAPIGFKCGDIYCNPGVEGDKACVNDGCGYCNKLTSTCARYPELSEKRQGTPEQRAAIACDGTSAGWSICRDHGCYKGCDKWLGKCIAGPPA